MNALMKKIRLNVFSFSHRTKSWLLFKYQLAPDSFYAMYHIAYNIFLILCADQIVQYENI